MAARPAVGADRTAGLPAPGLFPALLLAQWYPLSDPGIEEALAGRLSFRRFCGLGLDDGTPDETTLCRFRGALAERGLAEALFAELNRALIGTRRDPKHLEAVAAVGDTGYARLSAVPA